MDPEAFLLWLTQKIPLNQLLRHFLSGFIKQGPSFLLACQEVMYVREAVTLITIITLFYFFQSLKDSECLLGVR